MTPDLLALARAVIALPGWRWMPGMATQNKARVIEVNKHGGLFHLYTALGAIPAEPQWPYVPDLTDAATGGCMLAMLGDVAVEQIDGKVCIIWPPDGRAADRNVTLAEACARVALARGGWRT